MKQSFRRFLSAVLVITLLLGMIPVYGTATEKEGYLSPDDGKMDTSYLRISMEKYESTVSASSLASSKGTSVLEYTQWQMTATFIRVLDGKVEAEQDVTDDCTWASSDSTGQTLVVSESGLVTAYRASDTTHVITASYEGFVAVTGADGATAVQDKTFVANMPMAVVQLNIPKEDEEALLCYALTYLVNNEWSNIIAYEGWTVADWIAETRKDSYWTTSPKTEEYLSVLNKEGSAKVLHFLLAAAGECKIMYSTEEGTESFIRTVVFRSESQDYIMFAIPNIEESKEMASDFASMENNGKRKFEWLARNDYKKYADYFKSALDLYNRISANTNHVIAVGEFFGGTIAKYVSYVTGCESVSFDAPSPIQYVIASNFSELCENYSVYKQINYNSNLTAYRSTMYNIEPSYRVITYFWDKIPLLQYETNLEKISIRKNGDLYINKEQTLWNRRTYLGDNHSEIYDDTGAIGIKLNNSVLFGGSGSDTLSIKYAQLESAPIILVLNELIFGRASIAVKAAKVALSLAFNIPTGGEDIALLAAKSTINSNVISGGLGNDAITGSAWNNAFYYSPGDGEDIYYLKGFWNKFYLVGYGNEKIKVTCDNSKNEQQYVVTIGGTDTFIVDVSDCVLKDTFKPFIIYQGTPDNAKEIFVSTIKLVENLDAWSFACPVDIQILDTSGQVVQELQDGKESFVETEYGVFGVALEDDEYIKTVILFDNNYRVQVRGTGNGEMKVERVQWTYDAVDGQYCSIDNIPVQKDAVYYPSDNLEECILQIDLNGDGIIDETINYDTTVSFAQDAYEISYGTQKQLTVDISTTSKDRNCVWLSTDDSVVAVDEEGYITAMGFGEAEIYAMVADGSGAYDTCTVTVPEKTLSAEDFTVTGMEQTYAYTGKAIEVALEVSYGCLPLMPDVHYTADFSQLVEPGKATLTITGINDYSGTIEIPYEITVPKEPTTVEEKVDWIAAKCRAEGITDDWEIALWLHDWLVYNANYDYTYTHYSPYGVLMAGTGVCQSYADAYRLLLDEFSIENQVITSAEMDHAWNLVKLDGKWCHIDCTWDDPGIGGAENYIYFGMNDALMARDHVWPKGYPASTSKANYYYVRNDKNTATTVEEAQAVFAAQAKTQNPLVECIYIGEDADFLLMDEFDKWYGQYDWKYGIEMYEISGTSWGVTALISYTEPWEQPGEYIGVTDCPSFTLRGPEGVYPLAQYDENGVLLVFGRTNCGNTLALLEELNGRIGTLNAQGIQVFANLENTFVPGDFTEVRSWFPNITYTYSDGLLQQRLLEMVDPGVQWLTYPLVFVINRDREIIYYSSGYVADIQVLLNRVKTAATNQKIPTPKPVDDNYYGSVFNYTGDKKALTKMIGQQLADRNSYIVVRDGTWSGAADSWNSETLAYAMFEALDACLKEYGPYTVPGEWTYYSEIQQVLICVEYPENVDDPTKPTEPGDSDKPNEPTVPEKPNKPTDPVYENPFEDVFEADYYYDPVLWAVNKGITNGIDATHFAPAGTCTRSQIVTFLWRANGSPEAGGTNPFTDVPADAWYTNAVLWAVENGITTGTSATTFSPDAGCTRGQVATFLWRSQGQPSVNGENIFTDIAPGAYYYDAVLWAVANGITNGMGEGLFAPDATCTRGQIVTFLYRAMG